MSANLLDFKCAVCGEPVLPGQGYHSVSKAHWECHKAERAKDALVIERGERALAALPELIKKLKSKQ